MKDVCKVFLFALAGAILAMPDFGPVGLLGVLLAAWYLYKNAGWLLPPGDVSRVRSRNDKAVDCPRRRKRKALNHK